MAEEEGAGPADLNASAGETGPPAPEHRDPPAPPAGGLLSAGLKEKLDNFRTYHETFNRDSGAVRQLIREGIVTDAVEPLSMICVACAAANSSSVSFSHAGREHDVAEARPFHSVEIDVWGPYRNRYLWGAICRAHGYSWLQPISAKSDAVKALRAFVAWIAANAPRMEAHLGLPPGTVKIHFLHYDRGGENTTTHGETESARQSLASRRI